MHEYIGSAIIGPIHRSVVFKLFQWRERNLSRRDFVRGGAVKGQNRTVCSPCSSVEVIVQSICQKPANRCSVNAKGLISENFCHESVKNAG